MKARVVFGRHAEKQIPALPCHIAAKLAEWIDLVRNEELAEARGIRGYRDEALLGARRGQRSIRLNRSWRAIYVVLEWPSATVVRIEEVNKHEY